METSQLLTSLIGLAYLFYLAIRPGMIPRRRKPGLGALSAPPHIGGGGFALRIGAAFTAGFGLAWLLRPDPVGSAVLAGGAIALAAGTAFRLGSERRGVLRAVLALLDRLERETAAGADFFVALGAARGGIPDGRLRRAVDEALDGYARRRPLGGCLRPLAVADRTLAGMAADLRRIGWEASPLLARAVGLVHAAAIRRWDRGRGARVRIDQLRSQLPGLQAFAAGAAAAGLGSSGTAVTAGGAVALAGILGLAYLSRNATVRRLVRVGGSLVVLAALLPAAAAGGPVLSPTPAALTHEPAASPARSERLPEPLQAPQPVHRPIFDLFPDRRSMDAVETCRIETGVPGGLVNVRERPGMAGVVRFYAADGELLQTIGETGGAAEGVWRRVRTDDGRSGWVYAPLCVDER